MRTAALLFWALLRRTRGLGQWVAWPPGQRSQTCSFLLPMDVMMMAWVLGFRVMASFGIMLHFNGSFYSGRPCPCKEEHEAARASDEERKGAESQAIVRLPDRRPQCRKLPKARAPRPQSPSGLHSFVLPLSQTRDHPNSRLFLRSFFQHAKIWTYSQQHAFFILAA